MLRIIQISDLHLNVEKDPETKQAVISNGGERILQELIIDLKKYLSPLQLESKKLTPLLFFAGDAIDKGGKSFDNTIRGGREKAFEFFYDVFLKRILDEFPILEGKVFITPGNHDVTGIESDAITKLVREMDKNPQDRSIYNTLKNPIKHYMDSKEQISWLLPFQNLEKKLYKNYDRKILSNLVNSFKINVKNSDNKDIVVGISCINTAWLSNIRKDSDSQNAVKFVLTHQVLDKALSHIGNTDYKIFFSHYPLEDLLDESGAEIRKTIKAHYSIVLNGHSHRLRTILEDSAENKEEILFTSSESTLSNPKGDHQSGYKIIDYYEGKRYDVYHREYYPNAKQFRENLNLAVDDGTKSFYLKGGILIEATIDEAMTKTINKLEKDNPIKMRVIGIGRQDMAGKNKLIRNYYSAISSRLNDSAFTLQRITSMKLLPEFKKHIIECFENAEQSNSTMELTYLDDMDVRFTYYIIDDNYLVINVYQREKEGWDCPYAYYSNDKTTVGNFIKVFDTLWQRKKEKDEIITSKNDFENRLPFENDYIGTIGHIMRTIPRDSIRYVSMINELNLTIQNLNGIKDNIIKRERELETKKLQNIFTESIKILGDRGNYRTISFFEFWKSIQGISYDDFINANCNVLQNSTAKIYRIYVIDRSRINTDIEYREFHKKLLLEHAKMLSDNPNYYFQIFFVDKKRYNRYLHDYKNFALWESKTEGALFMPYYEDIGDLHVVLSKTEIKIFEKGDNTSENNIDNKNAYDKYVEDFRRFFTLEEKQLKKLNPDDIQFLEYCGINSGILELIRERHGKAVKEL